MTYHLGPVDHDRRAELYGDTREEEPQPRPRRVLATALALLVMGLFGGGLWFAYVQGTRHAGGDAAGGNVPLIRELAGWPRVVESAAEAHEPHRIAFYLQEVAAQFHMLWNKGKDQAELRFIRAADPSLTCARLALVRGVAIVIASGLAVIGVEPVEEM